MAAKNGARIVLVTCGNRAEARKIADSLVEKRLAACATIVSAPVESVYRWKGKVEKAREVQLLIKTQARRLGDVEREVARLHGYEVPEFLVLAAAGGSKRYLGWLNESVR